MSFDWQTEEALSWPEPPPPEPQPEPTPRPRWWRWLILVVLLVLLVGMVGALRLVRQRVEVATAQAKDEVLASYELIARAAEDGDAELVATFLSGRNRDWSAAVEQAVKDGSMQNRESFGLTWLPADPATAVISTTLNPQFTAAEVVAQQEYAFPIGNGLTDTVRLRQTAVYRLGPDRWLLAPPDDDFWGETRTKPGFYLMLEYPARDEVLAQRLALDLDTALAALCANPDFTCPENLHVQVEFSTDPATLTADYASAVFVDDGRLFRLPTPTLVGLPQDETGYQVMARGYAVQVLLPIMRQLAGIVPGEDGLFVQAWLDWHLARSGLRPYSLTKADRTRLAAADISLTTPSDLAAMPEEERVLLVYALTAFLLQDVRVPSQTLLQLLAAGQADTFAGWLPLAVAGHISPDELEIRWQQFLEE